MCVRVCSVCVRSSSKYALSSSTLETRENTVQQNFRGNKTRPRGVHILS